MCSETLQWSLNIQYILNMVSVCIVSLATHSKSITVALIHLAWTYLLKVNKARLVGVQHEALAVGTHRVLADVGLRVAELLLHVLDGRLAVQTEEGAADQLGVDGVSAHHLAADAEQGADSSCGQLSNARWGGGEHQGPHR